MEIISYGRLETARDRNIGLILAYCRSRKDCGRGALRCPLSRICGRERFRLITDFGDEEITEALRLIAVAGC